MRFNNFRTYQRIWLSKRFISSLWRSRHNIIAAGSGLPPLTGPFMAELDVTYRCDCRCQMCQRWQDQRKGEMTFEEYAQLGKEFQQMGVHLVSIAGGEPLLREDIFPIIQGFTRYGMAVNLCTNGHLLERYAKQIARSGASCVTVSMDGATARTHERVRGIAGCYEQVERGVQALLAFAYKERPILRIRMTICGENEGEVGAFYRKWECVADDVLLQPVHHCRDAFYAGKNEKVFYLDPKVLSQQLTGTPFQKRNGYMHKLLLSLRRSGEFPVHRCYAGILMVRVDPWGHVYPCLEQHVCAGSVRSNNFRAIWNSDPFNIIRKSIAKNGDCKCWYNNTALISHYAAILEGTSTRRLSEGLQRLIWPRPVSG